MSAVFSDDFKAWLRDIALTVWDAIRTAAVWVWSRYARELVCFGIGLLVGLLIMSAHTDKMVDKTSAEYEAQIAEIVAVQESNEIKKATEGQKISLYRDVARALYGIKDYGLSNDGKRAYIQIMLNRANPNVQYDVMAGTDDLASVLAKPNQWQGYRRDGNYTEADFQLVKEFLESGNGNFLNSDKYFWCEVKQGYIICKADINGKTSIPDQVVQ
jgi:hypothetical protein